MMGRLRVLLYALALLFAAATGLLLWRANQLSSENSTRASLANIGGPFGLVDQNGHPRTDRDFRGRYMLIYFGYSFCPDVCPTTLANIANAMKALGPKAQDIVPIFITIDPARDTPKQLSTYLASFGPQFVGLTGTEARIATVAHAYRVYYARHPLPGGSYAMDHSSTLYLDGPDGKLVAFYDADTTSAELVKDLKARI